MLQYMVTHDPAMDMWALGAALFECMDASLLHSSDEGNSHHRNTTNNKETDMGLSCRAFVALLTDLERLRAATRGDAESSRDSPLPQESATTGHYHADGCYAATNALCRDEVQFFVSSNTTTACDVEASARRAALNSSKKVSSPIAHSFVLADWPACMAFEQEVEKHVLFLGYGAPLASVMRRLTSPIPARRPTASELVSLFSVQTEGGNGAHAYTATLPTTTSPLGTEVDQQLKAGTSRPALPGKFDEGTARIELMHMEQSIQQQEDPTGREE